jgi:enoyl-CoA hydratase/carnithine racemase
VKDTFETLVVEEAGGICTVTIDNPPLNIFEWQLMRDLEVLSRELEESPDVRVVVFQSANDEFFIAHADVNLILLLPEEAPPRSDQLGFFHALVERVRQLPQATIAKITGCVRGGGSEFVLSCDMRFASDNAVFGQPEVALGLIPGGGGTQRLARLAGRSRALEIVLGCADFDADLAERYGWINRVVPSAEIDDFVGDLAGRIAAWPAAAVRRAKTAVDAAELGPVEGLLEEADLFNRSVAEPESRARMRAFLESGGQTRDVELNLGARAESLF